MYILLNDKFQSFEMLRQLALAVIDFSSGLVAHGQSKLIRTSDFCQIFSIESIRIF